MENYIIDGILEMQKENEECVGIDELTAFVFSNIMSDRRMNGETLMRMHICVLSFFEEVRKKGSTDVDIFKQVSDLVVNLVLETFMSTSASAKGEITYSGMLDALRNGYDGKYGYIEDKEDEHRKIMLLQEMTDLMRKEEACNEEIGNARLLLCSKEAMHYILSLYVASTVASAANSKLPCFEYTNGEEFKDGNSVSIGFMKKPGEAVKPTDVEVKNTHQPTMLNKALEYRHIEERMSEVVSHEEIDRLATEIITRALYPEKAGRDIVIYGVSSDIQAYLVNEAMRKISECFPSFTHKGILTTIENGGLSEKIVRNDGEYVLNIILTHCNNNKMVKDIMDTCKYRYQNSTLVVETNIIADKLSNKSAYKVELTKEQFKCYIKNLESIEVAGIPFSLDDSARNEIYELIESGCKFSSLFNLVCAASIESVKRGYDEPVITGDDIKLAVENVKGITDGVSDEISLVRNLDAELKKHVKGQDEALDAVVRAVKIAKAGLNEEDKPIASFMFVGPTGTGKTETAKQLAKALNREFIRIDMGDYKDQTSVNKFNGVSAGYVGYDDGSVLGKALAGKEHCVLLFDEIEKAHSSVYDVMMHMLDNGEIKDNKGNIIDFRDAIIIMTSNVGARRIDERGIGFNATTEVDTRNDRGLSSCVQQEMEATFKPEFINRFDAIVQYNQLNVDVAKEIVIKFISELALRAKRTITASGDCINELALKGTDIRFGAREIKRIIDREIKIKLAECIISGEAKNGQPVELDFDKEHGYEVNFVDKSV